MTQANIVHSPLIIIIAITLGFLLAMLIARLIKKWGNTINFFVLKLDFSPLCRPLYSVLPAILTVSVVETLTIDAFWLDMTKHLARVWAILSFGWLAIAITDIVMTVILTRHDMTTSDNLRARQVHTQIKVTHKIAAVFIFLITVALALTTFNSVKQIGISILASAGVFGIIIGFAAQKMLGNLLAGIHIALAQPIRLDDVVIVEGEWGRIEEITLTYVVVKIWDERRLVLPISYFTEKPFQNWTRTSSKILGSVFIYTDYQMPVQKLREKLTELLKDNPLWDKDCNVLQVTNATERTVELRALMSATDAARAWDLRCQIREGLIQYMQEAFPQHLPKTRIELNKFSEEEVKES